ncbi:MAG: hypothetical protein WBD24_04655 [Candidatus Omnitrophota bacterium]
MRRGRRDPLILLLISAALILSTPAYAERPKGVLIRFWERFSARFAKEKAPKTKVPVAVKEPARMIEEKTPPVQEIAPEEIPEEAPEEVPEKAPERVPEKRPKRVAPPEKKTRPMLPKAKMLENIERRLKVYPQIIDIIPSLSRGEDTEEGEPRYYHASSEGVLVDLKDLDKDTLYKLFVRVNHEATRIHTERLVRQIQQQEQLMRSIRSIPRPPQQPVQPPSPPPEPPKVYTPPKPPPLPPQPQRR